jgi:hypothetical protein
MDSRDVSRSLAFRAATWDTPRSASVRRRFRVSRRTSIDRRCITRSTRSGTAFSVFYGRRGSRRMRSICGRDFCRPLTRARFRGRIFTRLKPGAKDLQQPPTAACIPIVLAPRPTVTAWDPSRFSRRRRHQNVAPGFSRVKNAPPESSPRQRATETCPTRSRSPPPGAASVAQPRPRSRRAGEAAARACRRATNADARAFRQPPPAR